MSGVKGCFVGTIFVGFTEIIEGSVVEMSFRWAPGDVTFGTFGGNASSLSLGKSDGDKEALRLGIPTSCDNGDSVPVFGDNDWPVGIMLAGFADSMEGREVVGMSVRGTPGDAISIVAPPLGASDGDVKGIRLGVSKYCNDGESVPVPMSGVKCCPVGTIFAGFDDAIEGSKVGIPFRGASGNVSFDTFGGHESLPSLGKSA
jgi:hypothetical protein